MKYIYNNEYKRPNGTIQTCLLLDVHENNIINFWFQNFYIIFFNSEIWDPYEIFMIYYTGGGRCKYTSNYPTTLVHIV